MLTICHICLSTEKKVQAIEGPIHNLHDELCDFGVEEYALYCAECIYLLKKFQKFKEKCLQANLILKKWRKNRKARTKLNLLKNELPPSLLGVCNRKNHKIYFYQAQTETETSTENDNFTHTKCYVEPTTRTSGFSIDTLTPTDNIYDTTTPSKDHEDTSDLKIEEVNSTTNNIAEQRHNRRKTVTKNRSENNLENGNGAFKSAEVKIEFTSLDSQSNDDLDAQELSIKDEDETVQVDSDNDSDDEFDIQKILDDSMDSDNSSDNEVLEKKRKITASETNKKANSVLKSAKTVKKKCVSKKKQRERPGLEELKQSIMKKFENGEVKDGNGTVIDKDCILDNLEKMHNSTFNKVARYCSGPSPLTPDAIQVLSLVQERYSNQYSSVFATDILTTEEEILKEFHKRKEHETFAGTEHKCMLCLRGFKHKKLLEYHVAEYHNPERAFACVLCAMRFKTAKAMRKHTAAHRVVYKCKLCVFVTNYRNVMENHYHYHKGVKYPCKLCSFVAQSKPGAAAHMNTMHKSQHICRLCARSFQSANGLTQHKIRKHGNEEPAEGPGDVKCDSCNITFVSDEVYQTHLQKAHVPNDGKGYVFKTRKRSLVKVIPKCVCRVCGTIENSIGRLMAHFRSSHPSESHDSICATRLGHKYLCHECGKGFSNITYFKEHKNVHTGARPFACDQCPKTFHRRLNLQNHLERHLPPKRECPHCGKKFISASNLNNHIKLHIGIRRFTCDMCSKSFLHRSALNEHVQGVHLQIRRTKKRRSLHCADDQEG